MGVPEEWFQTDRQTAQHLHSEGCDKWLHLPLGCFLLRLCQRLGCRPAERFRLVFAWK